MTDPDASDPAPTEDAVEASGQPSWIASRQGLVVLAATGAILALAAVGLMLALSGRHTVNEVAWRAAIEAQLGHEIANWPTYRDLFLDRFCHDSDEDLQYLAAVSMDEGDYESLRLSISYACPDRLPQVEAVEELVQ